MKRKLPETITEEELIEILKHTKSKKKKLAYSLGFYEAMRISEIIKLKPENIDKHRKLIYIKGGKGGKDRNIPIAPEVLSGLRFLPIGIGIRALQIAFKKAAKDTLGKDIHFHTLRHSGATFYLHKKRWDLRSVQTFLGHEKIQTTEIYTHVQPDDLIQKMWE